MAEIEITDEMIAAGLSAFLDYDSRFEFQADAVVEIFRAMILASRGANRPSPEAALERWSFSRPVRYVASGEHVWAQVGNSTVNTSV